MRLRSSMAWLRSRSLWVIAVVFSVVVFAPDAAQSETVPLAPANFHSQTDTNTLSANPLQSLISEALAHSPIIAASRSSWQAQERRPIQESTLPDPWINIQNEAVGNPVPGNNLQQNDFAYVGYGFSQEIPFPGKLRLQGAVAQQQAQADREAYKAQQRSVIEQVRETYFNLLYLRRTLDLLRKTYAEFHRVAQITETQYEVGTARQPDILKAQLEMTTVLTEEQTAREGFEQGQDNLKAILGRDADSPEIPITNVKATAFTLSSQELRTMALSMSPAIRRAAALQAKNRESLKLAREGYLPDFSISYMYEKTGARFPDYYMATIGVKVPLYFWRRQTPAIAEAALEKQSADAAADAARLSISSQTQNDWIAAQTSLNVLKIFRDGLIPQAEATRKSALASYQVGNVDFQTVLSAELGVLRLTQQYYRTAADYEIAIARIRQIVGEAL